MQRTKDWFLKKRGKFSSSEIHKLCGIKGIGQTGQSYIDEKNTELLIEDELYIDFVNEKFKSHAMKRGEELEFFVKDYLQEMPLFSNTQDIYILEMPKFEKFCCSSPDRIDFENKFVVEIKCPDNALNHYKFLTMKTGFDLKAVNSDYYWQMQHQMVCSGYNHGYFVSFHPFFKENYNGENKKFAIFKIEKNEDDCNFLINRISESVKLLISY